MEEVAVAGSGALLEGMLSMLSFCIFILAVYGLSIAIAVLKAGRPIRSALEFLAMYVTPKFLAAPFILLLNLVKCPPCLSFWIGMVVSTWMFSPAQQVCGDPHKAMLIDGLAACGASWLLHVIAERLGVGVETL